MILRHVTERVEDPKRTIYQATHQNERSEVY